MNSHSCTFVTPRDRAIFQINQELLAMALADLILLRTHAQALNRARAEENTALYARYQPIGETPEEDTHGA